MKKISGNIKGIANAYVAEMFNKGNGIMSPAELHFSTLACRVNTYRISFLSSTYITGKWNLVAENPDVGTYAFCQLDKSAGREECTDMIECLMNEIISNDSPTDLFAQAVIRPLNVVAQKIWTTQDIAHMLEDENIEPTDDNIQKVIDTGILDHLSDCTDSEWNVIKDAIEEANLSVEWIPLCLLESISKNENGIPKSLYMVPSGRLEDINNLQRSMISGCDQEFEELCEKEFEELIDMEEIPYYKFTNAAK